MKTVLLAIVLVLLLAGAVGLALRAWFALADVAISTAGLFAMGFGIVFTLALGIGLMWLVFKSSRSGMDR